MDKSLRNIVQFVSGEIVLCDDGGCYGHESLKSLCKNFHKCHNEEVNKISAPIKRKDGLNEQEGEIMDLLVQAWNNFVKLEIQHPDDTRNFADGIHKCQFMLEKRILRRDYPEGYPINNIK